MIKHTTPKATILQIGFIDPITQQPIDWVFDCQNEVPAMEILEDGTILHGGYTITELQQEMIKAVQRGSRYPNLSEQ